MTKYRRADEIAADTTKDPLDKIVELGMQDLDSFMEMLSPTKPKPIDAVVDRLGRFVDENNISMDVQRDPDINGWCFRFKCETTNRGCIMILTELDLRHPDYLCDHIEYSLKKGLWLDQNVERE